MRRKESFDFLASGIDMRCVDEEGYDNIWMDLNEPPY